ncbi:hypothetical protein [Phocaeicola abscessus]|uniref:hypothetical protein n=1 Tax=Phocaeicola abscessus TaxID=555313 RepID=UPI0028ED2B79|nr:hypothetical protein [Phocaeicola abscessus]
MERLLMKYFFVGDITEAEKKELFHAMKRDEELKKKFAEWQNTLAVLRASEQQGDILYATYKLKDWKKGKRQERHSRFLWQPAGNLAETE